MKEGFTPKIIPFSPSLAQKSLPEGFNAFDKFEIPTEVVAQFLKGCDSVELKLTEEEKKSCEQLHEEYKNAIKKSGCKCKHKGIQKSYINKFTKLIKKQ